MCGVIRPCSAACVEDSRAAGFRSYRAGFGEHLLAEAQWQVLGGSYVHPQSHQLLQLVLQATQVKQRGSGKGSTNRSRSLPSVSRPRSTDPYTRGLLTQYRRAAVQTASRCWARAREGRMGQSLPWNGKIQEEMAPSQRGMVTARYQNRILRCQVFAAEPGPFPSRPTNTPQAPPSARHAQPASARG